MGKYRYDDLETEKKGALKTLEGMDAFQRENNKGIRFDRIYPDKIVEIYDINGEQKKMDEMIMKLDI